jgi:hypothetical protein
MQVRPGELNAASGFLGRPLQGHERSSRPIHDIGLAASFSRASPPDGPGLGSMRQCSCSSSRAVVPHRCSLSYSVRNGQQAAERCRAMPPWPAPEPRRKAPHTGPQRRLCVGPGGAAHVHSWRDPPRRPIETISSPAPPGPMRCAGPCGRQIQRHGPNAPTGKSFRGGFLLRSGGQPGTATVSGFGRSNPGGWPAYRSRANGGSAHVSGSSYRPGEAPVLQHRHGREHAFRPRSAEVLRRGRIRNGTCGDMDLGCTAAMYASRHAKDQPHRGAKARVHATTAPAWAGRPAPRRLQVGGKRFANSAHSLCQADDGDRLEKI